MSSYFIALIDIHDPAGYQRCPRRLNFDPPCRLNFDPGTGAAFEASGCG